MTLRVSLKWSSLSTLYKAWQTRSFAPHKKKSRLISCCDTCRTTFPLARRARRCRCLATDTDRAATSASMADAPSSPLPSPPGHRIMQAPSSYMTVKQAIAEQAQARLQHRLNAPPQVRMPPAWAEVHAKAAQQQSLTGPRAGPPPKVGFPRAEDSLVQPSMLTASCTSSVPDASAVRGHGSTLRSSSVCARLALFPHCVRLAHPPGVCEPHCRAAAAARLARRLALGARR